MAIVSIKVPIKCTLRSPLMPGSTAPSASSSQPWLAPRGRTDHRNGVVKNYTSRGGAQ